MPLTHTLLLLLCSAAAIPPPDTSALEAEVRLLVTPAADVEPAIAHLRKVVARVHRSDPRLSRALVSALTQNVADKRKLPPIKGQRFSLGAAAFGRSVVDYEAFKQDVFIGAGVFPKRYFGYFDLRYDTAAYERRMKEVITRARTLINASQEKRKAPTRVTDQEIATTFIAEGGAILLREKQAQLEDVHPVYGIGLDDIATGFDRQAGLIAQLDAELHTHLRELVGTLPDGTRTLRRNMTFDEALLGTAVMWLYEKELCAQKLLNEKRAPLETRTPEAQFIYASLVYNSGILFSEERIEQIRTFRTADYLYDVSLKSSTKRWPLPVSDEDGSKDRLEAGLGYPEQPTSWSAVYHVLQRYGGYAGLSRFTDVFDARGMYR